MYGKGEFVEKKDLKKEMYHLERGCNWGGGSSRCKDSILDAKKKEMATCRRAVTHFIIDKALDAVRENFVDGFVSKEDFEARALRGHQAALDATKK